MTGFTIVELLVVVVVIAILTSVTTVAYNGVQSRARTSVSLSTAHQVQQRVLIWNDFTGSYPNLAQLRTNSMTPPDIDTAGGSEGPLEAKLSSPAIAMGAAMDKVRADGGNTVFYEPCGESINLSGGRIEYWDFEKDASVTISLGQCPP